MYNAYVEKAKAILLAELKKASVAGATEVDIPCEGPENLKLFQQALNLPEVRKAFEKRGIKPVVRESEATNQVKKYVMRMIKDNDWRDREIGFQCHREDRYAYNCAFADEEVKRELKERNLKAEVIVLGRQENPKIVIATLDDFASGRLDAEMRDKGWIR